MAALGIAAFAVALYVLVNPELREIPAPDHATIDY